MPIRLTLCGLCTPSRPDVYSLVQVLRRELADEIIIREVECMAACDETPAVMIGHEYHPQVTASLLRQLVEARLGHTRHDP